MDDSSTQKEETSRAQVKRVESIKTIQREKINTSLVTRRVTADMPLSLEDQKGLVDFCRKQFERAKRLRQDNGGSGSPESMRALLAAIHHLQNWALFRDVLGMNSNLQPNQDEKPDYGIMTIARDQQTAVVIGFTMALIKDDTVTSDYVGIDGEDIYRDRREGIRLAVARNLALLQSGIHHYETSLWRDSIRMYQNAGIGLRQIAELGEENSPVTSSATTFDVEIDPEGLSRLAVELGIDPTQDPFTAQKVTI